MRTDLDEIQNYKKDNYVIEKSGLYLNGVRARANESLRVF